MNPRGFDVTYMKRLKEKRLPLLGDFELTDRCNLSCIHCCSKSGDRHVPPKELTTAQWFHIIRQMKDAGVVYLNLSGGEPLFRSDFKKIYLFAKKKNFAVTVITNGTLITQDHIRLFKTYPPLMLQITSYGMTQQAYESVTRTPGSFAMFQKAMGLLKGSGIRFMVRTMVLKGTYDEVIKNYRSILASGIRCVFAAPLYLRRDHDPLKNELIRSQRLSPDEIVAVRRKLKMVVKRSSPSGVSRPRYLDGCHCNTLGAIVLCDGTLTPCHLMTGSRLNLKRMAFMNAWRRSSSVDMLLPARQDAACGDCEHKAYCKWCPGVAYLETGDPKAKIPYLCTLMKKMHKKGA